MRCLLSILFFMASVTGFPSFAAEKCPDVRALATELLRAEVSGLRVAGAKAACLAPAQYPHLKVEPYPEGEVVETTAPLIVDEARPFEVIDVRLADDDIVLRTRYVIRFAAFVKRGSQTERLEDELQFRVWEGETAQILGCASPIGESKRVYIRPSCRP